MLKNNKIWTKNFIVICLSNFFISLNMYVLAAAFPLYVKDEFNGSQQQMGLAITVFVIGVVLIRPFAGRWVDQWGQKKIALIGMTIFLVASIAYFGAAGILLFFIIRFIHGMSYALASTAENTIASSIVPDSLQGQGMGYFSMFMSLAMVIGPAIGLFLWRNQSSTELISAICTFTIVAFLFLEMARLKKQPNESKPSIPVKRQRFHWSDLIELKALPISMTGFILSFSYSSISGFFPIFADSIHHSEVAGTFFIAFALMIVLPRPAVGKVFDLYGENYLFYPGIIIFGIGLLLLSQAHSDLMILLIGLILGTGYGALFSSFQSLAVKLVPIHRRGSATATFFLFFDSGYGLGSYFMGLIASLTDYRTMYVNAGIIALLSVFLYFPFHHRMHLKKRSLHS